MNKVFGLTGGIASGKTTVGRLLAERGAVVIDADDIARDVVAPGTPGLARVIEHFGESYLVDGALDREALGRLVFADERARAELNAILHPLIAAESGRRIGAARAGADGPVFYDASLLVESGGHRNFAGLVVVACQPELQLARIVERDGISVEEAKQRLAAQLPLSEKVAVADHVVWNDGTLDELERRVDELLAKLMRA